MKTVLALFTLEIPEPEAPRSVQDAPLARSYSEVKISPGISLPKYAILSHTWGDGEVSMQDIADPKVHLKEGYAKIAYTCDQALADGLEYAWVDTCKYK